MEQGLEWQKLRLGRMETRKKLKWLQGCNLNCLFSRGLIFRLAVRSMQKLPAIIQTSVVNTDRPRPSFDRVSVRYQHTISKVSIRYWPSVDETTTVSAEISADKRPALDRYSTDTRLTLGRYVDQVSTATRPIYWPSVGRYIDRWCRPALPTVNMIQLYWNQQCKTAHTASTFGLKHWLVFY